MDYGRLEVSSPGLDRPLKKPADWQRFIGFDVEVTLCEPFQNRRKWRGELAAGDGDLAWRLVLPLVKPVSKTAQKRAAKADAADDAGALQTLDFLLDEVREARLVPVVDFKGRRGPDTAPPEQALEAQKVDGGQD